MIHATLLEIGLILSFSLAGALLIHAIASQTLFGNRKEARKIRVRVEENDRHRL